MTLDVFPFQHIAVFYGQPVERNLDEAQRLNSLVVPLRAVLYRCLERIDRRLNFGKILDQHDVVAITSLTA